MHKSTRVIVASPAGVGSRRVIFVKQGWGSVPSRQYFIAILLSGDIKGAFMGYIGNVFPVFI